MKWIRERVKRGLSWTCLKWTQLRTNQNMFWACLWAISRFVSLRRWSLPELLPLSSDDSGNFQKIRRHQKTSEDITRRRRRRRREWSVRRASSPHAIGYRIITRGKRQGEAQAWADVELLVFKRSFALKPREKQAFLYSEISAQLSGAGRETLLQWFKTKELPLKKF